MREGEFTTRDGRRVTYGEFGAEGSRTVVHCHGGAESRVFEVEPEWTASLDVRLVTPDRPGFGASDAVDERDIASWTTDFVDLVEHLGVDDVSVLGWSAGGPHAMAAAACHPELVTATTVVAGPAPIDRAPEMRELLSPTMQMLADYAPADRAGAVALVAQVAESWVGDPDAFIFTGELPPADHAVLAHDELGANLRAQILEGLRSTAGIAHDSVALYRPWGFDVDDVSVPTSIWHGTADGVVHLDNGRWLADHVDGAQLHEIDEGGHFIALSHWREILKDHLGLGD